MADFSALPAELHCEIVKHAVSPRSLKRALRLRLVNRDFSREVKNWLCQSAHVLKDEWLWRRAKHASPESDIFWHPYFANKIIQKRWNDTDLCNHVVRIAERLCQISHPQGLSHEILRKITKQYVSAFVPQFMYMYSIPQFMDMYSIRRQGYHRALPLNESLHLLEMALLNGCHEGVKCALDDPVLNDMISHGSRLTSGDFPALARLAARSSDMILLAKIFSNRNLDPNESKVVWMQALQGAVTAARLDVVKFILEPPNDSPGDNFTSMLQEQHLVEGMLRAQSVDFCTQLFELLAPQSKDRGILDSLFDYDRFLRHVAVASPQRVDVAEWLLKQGATAHEEARRIKRRPGDFDGRPWDPLGRAIHGGNEQIVRLLLSYGVLRHGADARVHEEHTLEQAAKRGRLDIVRILVEHGACITARVPSTRPKEEKIWRDDRLMAHAVLTENEELCRYLMDLGAINNRAAMKAAIDAKLTSMVRLLLDYGADVPEDIIERAKRRSHLEVATILQAHHNND